MSDVRRALPVTLTLVALLSVTACSGTKATDAFERIPGEKRLAAEFRKSGPATWTVTTPRGTAGFRVLSDCVGGDGDIVVTIKGLGKASTPCSDESSPGGSISLAPQELVPPGRRVTITVSAPEGATWSAEVDAMTKETKDAGS